MLYKSLCSDCHNYKLSTTQNLNSIEQLTTENAKLNKQLSEYMNSNQSLESKLRIVSDTLANYDDEISTLKQQHTRDLESLTNINTTLKDDVNSINVKYQESIVLIEDYKVNLNELKQGNLKLKSKLKSKSSLGEKKSSKSDSMVN